MATRMEKYYRRNSSNSKRSERNQELYKDIYDSSSYSNIEGIATIEKNNEIDITKVKKMLKNREEYKRQKEVSRLINKPQKEEIYKQPLQRESLEDTRNYDIRDILDKAKDEKKVEDKYHNIDNTSYDILKKIKDKKDLFKTRDNEEDLKDLIDTITSGSNVDKMGDKELSLELLDDLKAKDDDDEVTKENEAIKNILREVKEEAKKESTTSDLDNSFFTSSLSFKEDDFEQLNNLNNNLMKNNILLKILVLIVLIAIAAGIIVLVFNVIK